MRVAPRSALLFAAAVGLTQSAVAQQRPQATPVANRGTKPITPEVIRDWNSIRGSALSNDGRWFAFVAGPTEGNSSMVLRATAAGGRADTINVGNGGGSPQISGDSKWIGYFVAPPRAAAGRGGPGGRGAGAGAGAAAPGGRGAGAPGQGGGAPAAAPAADSTAVTAQTFVLRNLSTGETKEFKNIRRFGFNADNAGWVWMQGGAGAPAGGLALGGRGGAPGGGGGGAQAGGNAPLLLHNLSTGETSNMGVVNQFAFNTSGSLLAYSMDGADQVGNGVQLRDMTTGVVRSLDAEQVLYRHLQWVDSSRAIAVMKGQIATSGALRDTLFTLAVFRGVSASGATSTVSFSPEGRSDFPTGMKLASDRAPRYSADLSQVFFGMREGAKPPSPAGRGNPAVTAGAPGMGGNINQTAAGGGRGGAADSLPSLILWHGRDERLQSQQMVQEAADRAFNYLVSYRFRDDKFVQLTDSTLRNVTVTGSDKVAYGTDSRAYQQQASFTGRNYSDFYLVDLASGARKKLWTKRLNTSFSVAPDGSKALIWGKDGHYWVLDLKTLDSVNITRSVPTSFVNSEDDHYNIEPRAIPARGWSKDGAHVLLYDNWDLWKVPTNPRSAERAVNLTGNGKREQIRYRTLYNWTESGETEEAEEAAPGGGGRGGAGGGGTIDFSKPMFIGTYGEWTKKEGVSRVDPAKPGAQSLVFEDARLTITKARNADMFAFSRGTFSEFPDWWVSNSPTLANPTRVSDVNPVLSELAISSGTRLIDYTSSKGDKLQGALYLPANYEPGKKYPLLVTIYEKRSQNKNNFVNPSETQTPNARMYTSRGYAVFDPDITYKINDPGMSAVWSVIPAVKAAIATGMIDEKNVGLWGHSWGGYQTAFLVTQTDIFKSAVAGAALTDMVSMYSSIYWNTGGSNQAIFESSQGRFKGNFIDNYEAYIRNSPVFHADKVKTPLMLLHNDKDGAVDFNQGVIYFNTLRQLQKEVIMLEYVGENHGVSRPVNQRDYARRMSEWFDHYLKGDQAPDWMTNGVPRLQIADHLYNRRDSTIATPRAGPVRQ
jgi:dipeptidyl aminopeptidase/acylaminoacyl peptidase